MKKIAFMVGTISGMGLYALYNMYGHKIYDGMKNKVNKMTKEVNNMINEEK